MKHEGCGVVLTCIICIVTVLFGRWNDYFLTERMVCMHEDGSNTKGGNRNNSMGWEQWTVAFSMLGTTTTKRMMHNGGGTELLLHLKQNLPFPSSISNYNNVVLCCQEYGMIELRIRIRLGELYESNETSTALGEGWAGRQQCQGKGCHTTHDESSPYQLRGTRLLHNKMQFNTVWPWTCALFFCLARRGSCKGTTIGEIETLCFFHKIL